MTKTNRLLMIVGIIILIAGGLTGLSLYLRGEQSTVGLFIIIGAAILGVAAFMSGLNDGYDLLEKLFGTSEQPSESPSSSPTTENIETGGDFSPGKVAGHYTVKAPSTTTSDSVPNSDIQTDNSESLSAEVNQQIRTKGKYSPGKVGGDYNVDL